MAKKMTAALKALGKLTETPEGIRELLDGDTTAISRPNMNVLRHALERGRGLSVAHRDRLLRQVSGSSLLPPAKAADGAAEDGVSDNDRDATDSTEFE